MRRRAFPNAMQKNWATHLANLLQMPGKTVIFADSSIVGHSHNTGKLKISKRSHFSKAWIDLAGNDADEVP